jgi:hypothetical protein
VIGACLQNWCHKLCNIVITISCEAATTLLVGWEFSTTWPIHWLFSDGMHTAAAYCLHARLPTADSVYTHKVYVTSAVGVSLGQPTIMR